MPKQSGVPVEKLLRALSNRTRVRLMNLLSDQEVCVCYLVETLKMSQPKVSRHLAYLRRAGLVAARRQGKWMHYRMALPENPAAARLVQDIEALFAGDLQMQQDRSRFTRACCAPQKYVRLQGAPVPVSLRSPAMPAGGGA